MENVLFFSGPSAEALKLRTLVAKKIVNRSYARLAKSGHQLLSFLTGKV